MKLKSVSRDDASAQARDGEDRSVWSEIVELLLEGYDAAPEAPVVRTIRSKRAA